MPIRDLTPWNWFRGTRDLAPHQQPSNMNVESPLLNLQRDIDRMFDNFLQGFNVPYSVRPAGINAMATPRINITETRDAYQISAELPGVEEQDVDISLSGDVLTIKGERREEQESSERNYHRIESAYGAFQRSITLPEDADRDNISANFRNGILTIEVGKNAESQAETRKIPLSNQAA